MKFLDNFNTNLDVVYIKPTSFIVKNYFMYLLSSWKIIAYLGFILVFFLYLYLQHNLFDLKLWTTLNMSYSFLVGIWLFFHLKFLGGYIKKYRPYYDINSKFILEEQDKRYGRALYSSLFILLANIILSIFSLFYLVSNIDKILWLIAFIVVNIALVSIQWIIIKKSLIDFEMDFAVVDLELGELIVVEQAGFLSKKVTGLRMNLISSVNSSSSGLLRSWLWYGRIIIQTVSTEQPNIEIRYVKNPSLIENMIKLAINKVKKDL